MATAPRQPFEAGDLFGEHLATCRRQVAAQKRLLDHLMGLAERNYDLEAEVAVLIDDKEALHAKGVLQEEEFSLLEREVARLQSSNAQLQSDLDAEASRSRVLEYELENAGMEMDELREDYARNLYDVRQAYTLAQRECTLEVKEAEQQREVLEERLRDLTAQLDALSQKQPGEEQPPQASASEEPPQASASRCAREEPSAESQQRLEPSAESQQRLERQHAAEAELARLAARLHAKERQLAAQAQESEALRGSRDKLAEENAQLHAACADLMKAPHPTGQPHVPAPAEYVEYEKAATAPATPAATAPRVPLSANDLLAAELGSCLQLQPLQGRGPAPIRDDSLTALLADEYVEISVWAES